MRTDRGEVRGDVYVLSLGSYSPLLEGLGERLPVYPIKGYSLTLPIDGANNPPTVGGIDEDTLCAYVRLGDRLRATSIAEFAGYDTSHRPGRLRAHPALAARAAAECRRLQPAAVLGVPAPDDARGHADPRPRPLPQPVLQHRPRPPGLDHGLRHGADHRRSDRAAARPICRWTA